MLKKISYSPCKPGVAGLIPVFSENNNKKTTSYSVEPLGAPGTTNDLLVLVNPGKEKLKIKKRYNENVLYLGLILYVD